MGRAMKAGGKSNENRRNSSLDIGRIARIDATKVRTEFGPYLAWEAAEFYGTFTEQSSPSSPRRRPSGRRSKWKIMSREASLLRHRMSLERARSEPMSCCDSANAFCLELIEIVTPC